MSELEVTEPEWAAEPDEMRRIFVFLHLHATSDIEQMDKICKWLKNGTVPHKLRAVKD